MFRNPTKNNCRHIASNNLTNANCGAVTTIATLSLLSGFATRPRDVRIPTCLALIPLISLVALDRNTVAPRWATLLEKLDFRYSLTNGKAQYVAVKFKNRIAHLYYHTHILLQTLSPTSHTHDSTTSSTGQSVPLWKIPVTPSHLAFYILNHECEISIQL
jgi:hypothetical protein